MKKLFFLLILIPALFAGCKSGWLFGKLSKSNEDQITKIENVQKAQNVNVKAKMDEVSVFASGIDYSLNKITNKEPPALVAFDLNRRIMSLSGKPNLDAEKEMWKIVDGLVSELQKEKDWSHRMLTKKDSEIVSLQRNTQELEDRVNAEIQKYIKISSETAKKADAAKAELEEWTGMWGLKGVAKGSWKFITTSLWFIAGFGLLFFILRTLASTNPIAGAFFKIFDVLAGYFIKFINLVVPRAIEMSGNIATSAYNSSKVLLTKIVDSVEWIKQIEKTTGSPVTLKALLNELDKKLDSSEKEVINKIKKDLQY